MTDLTALIEALEKATGPSRELDWGIYDAVQPEMQGFGSAPHYTSSLDNALTLVPEGQVWVLFECDPPADKSEYGALVGRKPSYGPLAKPQWRGTASTPALALCIAALNARA